MKIKMKKEIIAKVIDDLKSGIYRIAIPYSIISQATRLEMSRCDTNAERDLKNLATFLPDEVVVTYSDIVDPDEQKLKTLCYLEYFRRLLDDEEVVIDMNVFFDYIDSHDDNTGLASLFEILSNKIFNGDKKFYLSLTIGPNGETEEVYIMDNDGNKDDIFITTMGKLFESLYEYLCLEVKYEYNEKDSTIKILFEDILLTYIRKYDILIDYGNDVFYTEDDNIKTTLSIVMKAVLKELDVEML
jgi:hypothetical protein